MSQSEILRPPQMVCKSGNTVSWIPPDFASGYLVHSDGDFLATVEGYDNASFELPDEHAGSEITISSYMKTDHDADDLHSSRSEMAITKPLLPEELGLSLHYSDTLSSGIDQTVFNTEMPWGRDVKVNRELHCYVDPDKKPIIASQVFQTVPQSHLRINAVKDDAGNWHSGLLSTSGKLSLGYRKNYIEVMSRSNKLGGFLGAFWAWHEVYAGNQNEFDVVEFMTGDTDRVYHTYHHRDKNNVLRDRVTERQSFLDIGQWHKYGLYWAEGLAIWYVDGMPVMFNRSPSVTTSEEMFLIMNLAVGGDWPGSPAEDVTSSWVDFKNLKVYIAD